MFGSAPQVRLAGRPAECWFHALILSGSASVTLPRFGVPAQAGLAQPLEELAGSKPKARERCGGSGLHVGVSLAVWHELRPRRLDLVGLWRSSDERHRCWVTGGTAREAPGCHLGREP
jgi:hypothetical protein